VFFAALPRPADECSYPDVLNAGLTVLQRMHEQEKSTRVADRAFPSIKVSWRQPGDFARSAAHVNMRPLTPDETEAIESALAGMRTAYNQFKVEACEFTGIPDDLSSLDYIPYELPMPEKYAAGSVAFALAWGNVLATSFGFSWVALDHFADPKGIALRHEDPSALIVPYFRLLEITQSSGCQNPAESLWFDVIRYFDHRSCIPDGWHPVFDAVHCSSKLGCPNSTSKACQRLIEVLPVFYATMSTYPYDWARNKQWHKLTDYADQLATNYQSTNQ
jgi:hypothetical protein